MHDIIINDKTSEYTIRFNSTSMERNEQYERHKISENQILFILRGEILLSCNEFINRRFKTGDMVFIPKLADYQWTCLANSNLFLLDFDNTFNLYEDCTTDLLSNYCKGVKYNFRPLQIMPVISSFLQFMEILLKDGLDFPLMHQIKQRELFLLFREYYTKEELAEFFMPVVGKNTDFKNVVLDNYMKINNIPEFAQLTGCSVSTFKNKFKKHFGEPAYHWMLKQKSKHILHAISVKNMDLAAISREFGFSSLSHFNRFCRTQFGTPPRELRKKIMENEI